MGFPYILVLIKNFIIEIDKEKVVDVCFGCGFKTCVAIVRKKHYLVVTNI